MNLSFKIELYYSGKKSTLYTIRINGEKENEFDKFLNNSKIKSSPEFGQVLQRIKDIADRYGCQEHLFEEKESKPSDAVVAIKRGNIRLYCCRIGHIVLILGPGGIKETRTYQEDADLHEKVKMMAYVSKLIDKRIIKDKEIKIINNMLIGDLHFEKE